MAGLTHTKLAILGSTGSIGRQTLDVVRAHPDKLSVVGLAAGYNLKLLSEQIREFHPQFAFHLNDSADALPGSCSFMSMEEMAARPEVDIVVAASSGASGLMPLLSAIKAGKTVALSNKEALVTAGEIVTGMAKQHHADIRPVDSEHSAVWQCLKGEEIPPSRIILTASGGPFRGYSRAEMAGVTAEQALRHPSWKMGKKVTIDSATLMNKGLEVIEAHWLFDMPFEKIDVLVHPQSVIHSMLKYPDGAIKAQLGAPDMRLPIQYALSYPDRWGNDELPRLDFNRISRFDFEQPDYDKFPCLKLAIEAGRKGGTYPAAMCAADEVAVERFLEGRIKFTDIAILIDDVLARHQNTAHPCVDDILRADAAARRAVEEAIQQEKLHC
jgi:1-deoxy-D-xylulose-5-phosphate reductoisomerase